MGVELIDVVLNPGVFELHCGVAVRRNHATTGQFANRDGERGEERLGAKGKQTGSESRGGGCLKKKQYLRGGRWKVKRTRRGTHR
jgi:hypothetical protein